MIKRCSVLPLLTVCIFLAVSCSINVGSSDKDEPVVFGSQYETEVSSYTIPGASYYVSLANGSDANNGSSSSPFKTVKYALSQVSGGDVIYVGDGDYGDLDFGADYESHAFQGYNSPIATIFDSWVTLLPWDNAEPSFDSVVLGTWNSEKGPAIPFSQLGNSDLYLRIDGFRIKEKVKIYGSRHVEIRNCTITQKGDFDSMTDTEKADFMATAGVTAVNGAYITVLNNDISHTGIGIYEMTTDFICKGNHIHNLMHDAIRVLGGKNLLFEGNIIHDLDDGAADNTGSTYNMHVDGMQIFIVNGAAKYPHDVINFTFRNNLVYHAEAMGIMLNGNTVPGGVYKNFLWENNIFAPSNGTLFHMGAEIEGTFVFRNNTVVYTPNDQWTSDRGRHFGQNFADPNSYNYGMRLWYTAHHLDYKIYNNILTTTQVVTTTPNPSNKKLAGYAENNLYYNTKRDSVLDNNAGWKTTTLPYTAIPGNIQDVIDAGIIPGTLYTGSQAIDAGATNESVPIIEDDYAGNVRTGISDIGALEF